MKKISGIAGKLISKMKTSLGYFSNNLKKLGVGGNVNTIKGAEIFKLYLARRFKITKSTFGVTS